MAENILSARINITAPGADQAFKSVSQGAQKTEAQIKKLNPEVSKLGNNLETLRAKLLARQSFLLNETDVTKVAKYNREIKALQSEIERVGNIGASGFGKIGEKAGSAFGVVRKLAFVLPGIGIAGIFDVAIQGISKLIDSIGSVGVKFNEAAVNADVFRKANEKVGDDNARLQALVSVARDVTLTTTERKNAIAELQRLYPDYLRNITLENINSAAASKAIDDLTKSIINKAIAEVFSHKVAEETLKLMDLQVKREELLGKQGKAAAELVARSQTEPINAIKKLRGQYDFISATLNDVNKATNDQQDIVNKLTESLKKATIAELDFVKTPKEERHKALSDFDLMHNLLEILKRDAADLQKFFAPIAAESKKIRLAIAANIQLDPVSTNFGEQAVKVSDNLQREVDRLTKSNPILIRANTKVDLTDLQKQTIAALENINSILAGVLSDSLANVGDIIGVALAGGDVGKAFQAFTETIGAAVQAIGKQLISLGVAALLAKEGLKKLFANPLLEIAAGVALVAVGAALKSTLSGGLKGFAGGGPVKAGVPIIVGEQGREVFVPDTGGRIVPNNQISGRGISGGGLSFQIVGTNIIRGGDLITVFAAANRSNNRNF